MATEHGLGLHRPQTRYGLDVNYMTDIKDSAEKMKKKKKPKSFKFMLCEITIFYMNYLKYSKNNFT